MLTAQGITSVIALGERATLEAMHLAIQGALEGRAQAAVFPIQRIPGYAGIVVRSTGPSKATALEWIANHHGVSLDETVCVGDWHNDTPMLKAAGISFAMGHAPDAVKGAATHVLQETAATGGGIASAIAIAFPPVSARSSP
jgi:hydroxymethylpyrimidine pyrophosphatase-like HAD family hydrolase